MKKTNEFMNKYDKIEVIANDFGNEDYDFCSVVFYKDKEKKDEAFFPVSFRSSEMAQLLKILHETYGVMPDFNIKKVEEETTTIEAEYGINWDEVPNLNK